MRKTSPVLRKKAKAPIIHRRKEETRRHADDAPEEHVQERMKNLNNVLPVNRAGGQA